MNQRVEEDRIGKPQQSSENESYQNFQDFGKAFNSSSKLNTIDMLYQGSMATASGNGINGGIKDLMETLEKITDGLKSQPNTTVPTIDSIESPDFSIPVVLLSLSDGSTVYYSVLLIEGAGKPISDFENSFDIKQRRELTTAHYWGGAYPEYAASVLRAKHKVKENVKIISVAQIVVTKNIDFKNQEAISGFYDAAVNVITLYIRRTRGLLAFPFENFTNEKNKSPLAKILANSDVDLVAHYELTPGATYLDPITNYPLAGDFSCSMFARNKRKLVSNEDFHSGANAQWQAASAIGYVDVVWASEPKPDNRGFIPGYTAMVVITGTSVLRKSSRSNDNLLNQILAMYSVMPLISANSPKWPQVFEPSIANKGNKPSLGVVGLGHQPISHAPLTPKVLNVVPSFQHHANNPEEIDVNQLVSLYFTKGAYVALDIQEGGPLFPIQQVFINATRGSGKEAAIIAELDAFTGGAFSYHWNKHSESMVIPDTIVLYSGYYSAENGQIVDDHPSADIRQINFLAVMPHLQQEIQMFNKFTAGFLPNSNDQLSMQNKKELLGTLAPAWKKTGVVHRVMFNTRFFEALEMAMADNDLVISSEGLDENNVTGSRPTFNSNILRPVYSSGFRPSGPTIGGNLYQRAGMFDGVWAAPVR